LIWTDQQNAEIEYSIRAENPQFYPADFVLAFSYLLAFLIAPRVTGGDQFKLGERAIKMYTLEISAANADNHNEEQQEEAPESEFIRTRE